MQAHASAIHTIYYSLVDFPWVQSCYTQLTGNDDNTTVLSNIIFYPGTTSITSALQYSQVGWTIPALLGWVRAFGR